ncbi:hypothetical protein RirG_262420 [Rhizophagus irregularis DAOM 197198w]|uniref:Uncharacterized protein n=1 Tax=Rhizophagus irregularis (strain DAOM 197198w) TaxID=1432141 RepID=A0A015IC07_RHIIW|nr:hypothetical protein RirG_262420 [Rhizophagus irregularis DAOM 197198w]
MDHFHDEIRNSSKSIKCSSFSNEAYRYRAIQSEPCSGSDLVLSLVDNEQKVEEYGQDLDFDGVDYDLNYTENTGF